MDALHRASQAAHDSRNAPVRGEQGSGDMGPVLARKGTLMQKVDDGQGRGAVSRLGFEERLCCPPRLVTSARGRVRQDGLDD
jgi:hypothetical protein